MSQLSEFHGLGDANSVGQGHKPGCPQPKYHLNDVLEALPEAVYMTDAEGRITFYNTAAARLWGISPELGQSAFCGSWKLYWPDGTPLPHSECPMAMALEQRRPIRGLEAVAERPDGVRIPFLACPSPLFDEQGELLGAINMLVDLTDREADDQKAQRLAAIVESSDDAILAKDLNGTIAAWNRGAERLFGYTPEEAIGQPVYMLLPADRHDEEPEILDRIKKGERIEHYETVRRRKDGSLVDISLSVSPIRSRDGRIVGASKIARDITDRRVLEQQQRLLLLEMDHRVKNLFTLASGLVKVSARSAATAGELATAVSARLEALARAHALTVPATLGGEPDQTTTLHTLIRTITAPFEGDSETRRATIRGMDSPIVGGAITSLSLLLHEFATNAAKYGALSTPEGSIDISSENRDDRVVLTWIERGGPLVTGEPTVAGFGTLLAKATARGQLDGEVVREWTPEGLIIRLEVAARRLVGEAA